MISVAPRNRQGRERPVDCRDPPMGAFDSEGQGDAAGPRTNVKHLRFGGQRQIESRLDEQLGLRPWHEHRRADLEIPPPERTGARQMVGGLTGRTPLEPVRVSAFDLDRDLALGMES
jgi:hypothetical protein